MEKETMPGRNGGTLNKGGAKNGGRPRKLPQLEVLMANVLGEERDIKGEQVTAAEAILRSLLSAAIKGNVQAAKLLFERGYGQPKQVIEHSGNISTGINPDKLSAEEKRALLALTEKAS